MRWRDVSTPIRSGMPVYPGDPEVVVRRVAEMASGDEADVTALSLCAHTGTHVDAPAHAVPGGEGVESLRPDVLIGPARLVVPGAGAEVRADDPALAGLRPDCRRLLLRTGHGEGSPTDPAPALGLDAARALVDAGVVLVGIDTMSIGPAGDPMPVHRALLRAGVAVVEGLDLRGVAPGDYHLVCLPLLVPGADGAPARALLGTPDDP